MKKILVSLMVLFLTFSVLAQKPVLQKGIPSELPLNERIILTQPAKTTQQPPVAIKRDKGSPGIVTCIELGTSANAYGYGYEGGQRTIIWADDTLKAITNIHRMGPGTTPPGLGGYLAMDWATNMGQTSADWHKNWQIYAATLDTGGINLVDEAHFPQGGIYNPPGNTDINNAHAVYFAPNLSNDLFWGGYSYGNASFANQADSVKKLYWHNGTYHNNIPDGFTIMQNGTALVSDIEIDWSSGSPVYTGNLLVHRGIWNDSTNTYDYQMNIIVPLPTMENRPPLCTRIAASPDNHDVWMVTLANNNGTVQVDSTYYYPILFHSTDGGLTWSDPWAVQLDGPAGIPGIIYDFLSDYRIMQVYEPPYPSRDEIPYTTAFDCDLVVGEYGSIHIGIVVGLAGTEPYSISTGDSLFAVYDLLSCDDGVDWCAIKMGYPKTFRGTFGDITEDNRVNISTTEKGNKVIVSWLDTDVEDVTSNIHPDVFARGFDLYSGRLTKNGDGIDQPDNVTFLSDMMTQSYFATASQYLLTDNNGDIILPLTTELLSNPNDPAGPVTFYYIPDFAYSEFQFTVPLFDYWCCWVGVNEKERKNLISISPNPAHNLATLNITTDIPCTAKISIYSVSGTQLMYFTRSLNTGRNDVDMDISGLHPGVYLVNVIAGADFVTTKMLVGDL